jgi:hypothetical protein
MFAVVVTLFAMGADAVPKFMPATDIVQLGWSVTLTENWRVLYQLTPAVPVQVSATEYVAGAPLLFTIAWLELV